MKIIRSKANGFFFFDILCFWIFFEKKFSISMSFFEKTTFWKEYKIFYFNWQLIKILHNYKIDRKLSLLAQRLLKINNNLNDNEKNALKCFFNSVLNENKKKTKYKCWKFFQYVRAIFSKQNCILKKINEN